MKVILAGFSKCGTKSMSQAMTELGYEVYDFMENYEYLGAEWLDIFERGGTTEDFRRMFQNVDVISDTPACFFWEEIHKAFPDAKIVFLQREEDGWWKSMERQILSTDKFAFKILKYLSPSFRSLDYWGSKLGYAIYGCEFSSSFLGKAKYNEMLIRMTYRRHNSYVLQNAPKDKLLQFELSQGWGPLCEFLGVEVPDTEFPHKNKKAEIWEEMMKTHPTMLKIKREAMFFASFYACAIAGLSYVLFTKSDLLLSYLPF